jgi:Methyltransferase domain
MPRVIVLAGSLASGNACPGRRRWRAACGEFIRGGCKVVGTDLSEDGISLARRTYPGTHFEILAADEQSLDRLQEAAFDVVISTEVVEHLYARREGGQWVASMH